MGKFQHKYGATFPVSASLYKKVQKIVESVRQNPEGTSKRDEVIEIVNELTGEGLEYFFHYSLKIIGMNMIAKKAIKAGMSASKTTVKLLSKKFIRSLNDKQLLATVDFIDGFVSN